MGRSMKSLMLVISALVLLLWYAVKLAIVVLMRTFMQSESNVLRILVSSLGSPLWGKEWYNDPVTLAQFLHSLRASVRGAYAAAIVTTPNHLLQVVLRN